MDLKQFFQTQNCDSATLEFKVTPKASSNRIVMPSPDEVSADNSSPAPIRVYVTAVPDSGKANAAVIKLLAKQSGLPKSAFSIVSGQTNRIKRIKICFA